MEANLVVSVNFWAAFILDILIVVYASVLKARMGPGGLLGKVTLFAALTALVLGIHHILELVLAVVPSGPALAESVEGLGAILLGVASYQLFQLTRE